MPVAVGVFSVILQDCPIWTKRLLMGFLRSPNSILSRKLSLDRFWVLWTQSRLNLGLIFAQNLGPIRGRLILLAPRPRHLAILLKDGALMPKF